MQKNPIYYIQIDRKQTGCNVWEALQASDYTQEELMDIIGLSDAQSFTLWKSGKRIPCLDNLVRISQITGRSLDQLIATTSCQNGR